ncbi:MAG: YihY/virulence factor BrkB family protein [Opitutaceae bacterium]|nr:YihY/virulence factor BrkB family protein [Cytophagales bacterium]
MISIKKYAVEFWHLVVGAGKEFSNDNAMKLSASLSYYTIFSLAPMLLVIIAVCGIFFGRDAVQGEIYSRIDNWVGSDAALQIQSMLKSAQHSQQSWIAATLGVITLIIGATGVFIEIQDSINYIWSIKAKPKRGWVKFIVNRAISFSLILSVGFLMLVSLTINTVLDLMFDKIENIFPFSVYVFYLFNLAIVLVVITLLFSIIFKILPDGEPKWRDAIAGAAFTAILFMLGKFLIGYYLAKSNIATTYGSSSAIVIILLWIYYSSVILYFGAEFTKVYALRYGRPIKPYRYAVTIEKREIVITQEKAFKEIEKVVELPKETKAI